MGETHHSNPSPSGKEKVWYLDPAGQGTATEEEAAPFYYQTKFGDRNSSKSWLAARSVSLVRRC